MTILAKKLDKGPLAGECSTNRSSRSAFFATSRSGGDEDEGPSIATRVDTIRVRGVVTRAEMPVHRLVRHVDLMTGEVDERITGEYAALAPDVWLNVRSDRAGAMLASIEVSVPTYLRRVNVEASPVNEVINAIRGLYRLAERFVAWAQPVGALDVMRLDLVRDFPDVPEFDLLLDGLAAVPLSGHISVATPYRNARAEYTGLVRGIRSGGWTTRLYHKGRQLSALASTERDPYRKSALLAEAALAERRCRYEVEVRRPILARNGVTHLGDLARASGRLSNLAVHYFNHCRYGQEVGGMSKVQSALHRMRSTPENYKQATKMLGYLWMTAHDEPHGIKDARTVRRLSQLAERYGLTPADLRDPHRVFGMNV